MDQQGLVKHWESISETQDQDFRCNALNKLILKFVDIEKKVLDIGCGTCGLTLAMLKRDLDVTSIDTSIDMIEMAKRFVKSKGFNTDKILNKDISSFLEDNKEKFDQIVCLDVIEHIEDDEKALYEINLLLKPNGRLILTVPAIQYLYGEKDKEIGHYRRYERKDLVVKLKKAGFTVKNIRFWNFLGVLITFFFNKILHKRINENFRAMGDRSLKIKFLKFFFNKVENKISPPIGLTLLVIAIKK